MMVKGLAIATGVSSMFWLGLMLYPEAVLVCYWIVLSSLMFLGARRQRGEEKIK